VPTTNVTCFLKRCVWLSIDCVYHSALHELQATVKNLGMNDAADMLSVMIDGKRLKDISELPLNLAI